MLAGSTAQSRSGLLKEGQGLLEGVSLGPQPHTVGVLNQRVFPQFLVPSAALERVESG